MSWFEDFTLTWSRGQSDGLWNLMFSKYHIEGIHKVFYGFSGESCWYVHSSALINFLTKNSRLEQQKMDFGLKIFTQILHICQTLHCIFHWWKRRKSCKLRRIEPMKQSHLLSNGNNALLLFCLVNAKSGLHKLWTVLLSWADRGSCAPKCVS